MPRRSGPRLRARMTFVASDNANRPPRVTRVIVPERTKLTWVASDLLQRCHYPIRGMAISKEIRSLGVRPEGADRCCDRPRVCADQAIPSRVDGLGPFS